MSKLHYFNITYLCDSDCLFCAANVGIINHKEYTMTPEDFEKKLLKSNVQPGDKVMISGGEPTLSPYFWSILDICEKHNCCIDLTTNGHFFANMNNVELISLYHSVVVRIPFFGIGNYHDYLTGGVGNYKKAMKALSNFSNIVSIPNMIVNVKFLLCKATVHSNQEVYRDIYAQYGNMFEYTLSPILVSHKAIMHANTVLAPYSVLIKACEDFIEQKNINCDIIPLCLLSESKIVDFLKRKRVVFDKSYSDSHIHYETMDNYIDNACEICKLHKYCDGFLPSYIDYFGTEEIRPFI